MNQSMNSNGGEGGRGRSQINLTSLIKKTTKFHHHSLEVVWDWWGELCSLIMQKMQNYHPLNEFKIRRNPFRMGRNYSPRQLKFLLQLQRTINYSNRSRHSARSLPLSPSQFYAPESIKGLEDSEKLCRMLNQSQLLLFIFFLFKALLFLSASKGNRNDSVHFRWNEQRRFHPTLYQTAQDGTY